MMFIRCPRIGLSGLAAVALVLVLSGCGRKAPDFKPDSKTAEEAVRRGLVAWQEGQPAGEVAGTSPLIYVTDTGSKAGQVLESFQILGETHGSAGRTIAVLLRLANPPEELRTRYIVVGIDPLWVFRQEDYELLMHWDHRMAPPVPNEAEVVPGDPATPSAGEPETKQQAPE